jgi:DNA recombination protein Rad52
MAFDTTQKKALQAKLSYRYVKRRESNGATLAYVEGWHAIAEANRIFGFDSWDRQTLSPQCQWSEVQRGQTVCFYSTKVRITVRAGGTVTLREGIGTGLGRSQHREVAHEMALKAAETDATKRALATFGNPFGLALYDKEQRDVTRPRKVREGVATPPMTLFLKSSDGQEVTLRDEASLVSAVATEAERLGTVEDVAAFWSANLGVFTELRRRSEGLLDDPVESIIVTLRNRLRQVGASANSASAAAPSDASSSLLIGKEKRIRDRGHLAFVANQPCLVCGRRPAQAHHLKFAQPRGMSLKVSDEFTVPLCNTHHDALHRTGDERAWWARQGVVDPLKFAARLWAASRQRRPIEDGDEVQSATFPHTPDVNGRASTL